MRRQLISLNVGKPITVEYKGKELETGIYKQSVEGKVFLGNELFDGDGQADLVHHGGPDKAVCVYPYEHYSYWERELGKPFTYAAFGENLTVTGMLETEVCIGDTFQVGEAILQVSQPRYPCFKLSQKHGASDLPAQVLKTGFSGFYCRVLQTGYMSGTSAIHKLDSHPGQVKVVEILRLLASTRSDRDRDTLQRMMELDVLASVVREKFERWLDEPLLNG
ncbi:MOSC domain-containing protein [Paenibacillus antarcticus]|uniref:Sulfurase n=1 Tax=Paenibacillus antarcticus TaxID=253703 RepID=A0A168QCS9_9BACL|nr:MOSC domain-containing protein [Paenibacillus antarcticus]OAB47641.1 sulfurase [Paenibacillus antarcticus]